MNEMLNLISPALKKLSEIFCVSTDYIQAHAMQYILAYGKYHMFQSLITSVITAFILSAIFVPIGMLLVYMAVDDFTYSEDDINCKPFVVCGVIAVIVIVAITALYNTVPYLASPEIYSIQAAMELVKGK